MAFSVRPVFRWRRVRRGVPFEMASGRSPDAKKIGPAFRSGRSAQSSRRCVGDVTLALLRRQCCRDVIRSAQILERRRPRGEANHTRGRLLTPPPLEDEGPDNRPYGFVIDALLRGARRETSGDAASPGELHEWSARAARAIQQRNEVLERRVRVSLETAHVRFPDHLAGRGLVG